MARAIRDNQSYRDRLLKLIPSEIVAAFLVIEGILEPPLASHAMPVAVSWGVFAVLFVLTPLYLCQVHRVRRPAQLALTTATFAVWVYTLGGPFKHQGWHSATLASVLLVLWTLVIPLVPDGGGGERGAGGGGGERGEGSGGGGPQASGAPAVVARILPPPPRNGRPPSAGPEL